MPLAPWAQVFDHLCPPLTPLVALLPVGKIVIADLQEVALLQEVHCWGGLYFLFLLPAPITLPSLSWILSTKNHKPEGALLAQAAFGQGYFVSLTER